MRLVKDNSFKYGKNDFSVECKTESLLNSLTKKIDSMGWKYANTDCVLESDYGFCLSYCVDSKDAEDFKQAFKTAKATIKKGF